MSARCRLGYHHAERRPVEWRDISSFAKAGTNAVCLRCGKRLWRNWGSWSVRDQGGGE